MKVSNPELKIPLPRPDSGQEGRQCQGENQPTSGACVTLLGTPAPPWVFTPLIPPFLPFSPAPWTSLIKVDSVASGGGGRALQPGVYKDKGPEVGMSVAGSPTVRKPRVQAPGDGSLFPGLEAV